MRIAIASDHAGFDQKQQLVAYLSEKGIEVNDCGPANDNRVDYPDYAILVALEVAKGQADFGVLICGTGIGMAVTADKVPGIRAATITSPEFAKLSRAHNNCNVIALSGRFVGIEMNMRILDAFLATPFDGGRHAIRVDKIMALDGDSLPEPPELI